MKFVARATDHPQEDLNRNWSAVLGGVANINNNKFVNWFFSDSDDFNDFCVSSFSCSKT